MLVFIKILGIYLFGFYFFKFNDDNVLNIIYNSFLFFSIYWFDFGKNVFDNGWSCYNSFSVVILNDMGSFEFIDNLNFNVIDYGFGLKSSLIMDFDGVLSLYSFVELIGSWEIIWFFDGLLDVCLVYGLCGEFGICLYILLFMCICFLGFISNYLLDWSKGCKFFFNLSCDFKDLDFI